MSRPAKVGVVVYARDIRELSQFYLKMFGLSVIHETEELISLAGEGYNIVIHTPPFELPARQLNTVKLLIAVDSLDDSRRQATELGGSALDGEWSNPVFKLCNISDPQGNVIQLREFFL